ncbi:MAG: RNA polymerase sigma factor [Myxococcales bacterium]
MTGESTKVAPHLRAADSTPPRRRQAAETLALVEQARGGDEEAMHRLVLQVMPRVRNGVRYMMRGDHIDDMVQEVLVTVLQRIDSFRGDGRFEAWVDGVTMRVVLGRARKLRKEERRLSAVDAGEVAHLRRGERYATSRQLVRALDQIPDDQRTAVVMHHVFGLTAPEIASQLEIPRETVRSRLKAGMGHLRALLRVRPEDSHDR